MSNKLIVRIAEGFGNQLFMYAHSYALSKKINYQLLIDDTSGYFKKKDICKFELDKLNISAEIIDDKDKFNNNLLNFKRKILKNIDQFLHLQKFLIEKISLNKETIFYDYNTKNFSNKLHVEGHFESELYFKDHKNALKKEFTIKNSDILKKNKFYNDIVHNDRIVSICVRQNRYSERIDNRSNNSSINKSNNFTRETIEYINRAVLFCEKKIDNPIFYIWSNDFSGLREYFDNKKFIFVDNNENKLITDFYLMNKCKNFIVGPTTFHWWAAWLNYQKKNFIVCPKNLNPSNNRDFWPKEWHKI